MGFCDYAKALLLCMSAAGGCGGGGSDGGDGSPKTVTLSGAVEKGPFVLGSTINVSPLDATLNPTGQVFNTQTTDDQGQFSVDFMATGRVSLEGSGFYYNEVTGALSAAPITLRAIYDIKASGAQKAYVNLVTHLTFQRVKQLVSGGMASDAATTQAESELRTGLGIGTPGFMMTGHGIDLNILGGDTDANAYLLTMSSVVAQAAADRVAAAGTGSFDATLQELLNTTAADLAPDGMLQPALHQSFLDAQQHVDVDAVAAALRARLLKIGSTATVPDMNRVIDSDGDGIANANDNCPYFANPTQMAVPDGLCKFTTQSYTAPSGLGYSLYPVDLKGDKTYSVLTITQPSAIYLSKNDGTGALGAPAAISLLPPAGVSGTNNCCTLSILDMNNDKKDDLLRIDTAGWMAVYPGDGMGGFGAPLPINKIATPDMVDGKPFTNLDRYAAADFKKDGNTDLVGSFLGNTGVKIVLVTQMPGGAWNAPTIISSIIPSIMTAADVNKDGNQDIVFLDSLINGFHLYIGKGDGLGGFTIASAATFPANYTTAGLYVGDYNGDSLPDVLILAYTSIGQKQGLTVFFSPGDGNGGFGTPVLTAIKPSQDGLLFAGDFVGGKASALVSDSMANSMQLYTYQGADFVAGPKRPFIYVRPWFLADMDKNGKLDIVGTPTSAGAMSFIDVALQK